MTRRRWSDHDHNLGPFTYARDKRGRTLEIVLSSGDDDEYPGCYLRLQAFGHTFIANLPPVLRPWREKVYPDSWDAATVARLGRNWYYNSEEREYGFSYSRDMGGVGGGGFLQLFYGRDENFGKVRQRTSWFVPWNNWRHVRHCLYDLRGNLFWTEPERKKGQKSDFDAWYTAKESCPSRTFSFTDFDGEFLQAKTRIEERQWELGTGGFKWLSKFKKPIIHRSLDIEFSGETGKRKGSWKGGTIGHSIAMRSGELHMDAFMRYCEEHEMTYKGEGIWKPVERSHDDNQPQNERRHDASV